jgi:hypothetical protein
VELVVAKESMMKQYLLKRIEGFVLRMEMTKVPCWKQAMTMGEVLHVWKKWVASQLHAKNMVGCSCREIAHQVVYQSNEHSNIF